ncbi:MAG: hypothetical protein HQK49_05055 [Oligoflexia bacterium]|nr:hypothetical protein [Oligoflexia bacterium]
MKIKFKINKRKLIKFSKIFLTRQTIISIVTMLLLMFWFIKDWYLKQNIVISTLNAEKIELSVKIESTKKMIYEMAKNNSKNHENITDNNNTLLDNQIKMSPRRQNKMEIPDAIEQITKNILHNKMKIKTISLLTYKKNLFFNEYQLLLDINSPFLSIGYFLENIENSKMPLNVSSIQISRFQNELQDCRSKIIINGHIENKEKI